MFHRTSDIGRVVAGKVRHGDDLLRALTDLAVREGILFGMVSVIGAVQKAAVGYYHQDTKKYAAISIDRHAEIASCMGNISLRDDKPFVHAHIVLSGEDGECLGGHLMEGTIVFAAEFSITVLSSPAPVRVYDGTTGLFLWME